VPDQVSQVDRSAGPLPSFQRLLLATDFSAASQAAFETALAVCDDLRADLLLLHVFEYSNAQPTETGERLLELETFYEQARTQLDALRKTARDAGIVCETAIESGTPAMTILDTIEAKQIDLAVLGTNALHGFERLVFGSVAEDVLRKSPCPVLTVGPRTRAPRIHDQPAGPTVFATDFDPHTVNAIRFATSLSSATGSTLHCLHVLPRAVEAGPHAHSAVPRIVTEALQQLAAESGTATEAPICAVTYGSEISSAVVNYARETHARLIVLGVRQKSMMASHIPAHIAYRIVTEAPCPVLTMAFVLHKHTAMAACL
jgi:nucleotide-binding universal stress UspA family protein